MADPTLQDLADRIDEVAFTLGRQSSMLHRLVDEASAQATGDRGGADVPLLLDLFVLRSTVRDCATTARSRREREAFTAVAERLTILLQARGGQVVAPEPGDPFDAARMEAVEVVATDDPTLDQTVEAVAGDGLQVGPRSVRPARVVVRRHRAD